MSESAVIENTNPLRSRFISPELLADNAERRMRGGTMSEPLFAPIITKNHALLPLSIHNYNPRSFWSSSPLASPALSLKVQQIVDSQATLSDQNDESLALALASRALVTEASTGEVVSRSFMKFFNHDEEMAYKPTGREYTYEIQEKVDGSLISLFWYEPQNSSTGGQWIVASRTTFSSPHTESAWNILNTQYPSLVSNTQESSLDKTKTYVFELVDNRMPIKILYEYNSDLVLLAIFSKDGSEVRLGDTGLPFRRPRVWKLEELIVGENGVAMTPFYLQQLTKLHRANEEGFVITFWRTRDDVYPQRVKVKLEDYLKLSKPGNKGGRTAIDLSSRVSLRNPSTKLLIDSPPSPNALVDIYTTHRLSIPSFTGIDARMSSVKQQLLEAIQGLNVSDDYGGEAWLAKIMEIWDCIHALFSFQESSWRDAVKILKEEGHRSQPRGNNNTSLKQDFDRRIGTMDRSLTPSLKAWFEGQNVQETVKAVVENVEIPEDLKSTEVILL